MRPDLYEGEHEQQHGGTTEAGRDPTQRVGTEANGVALPEDQQSPLRRAVDGTQTHCQAIERIVLTPREAADLVGVSKTTMYRWMDAGEVPYVQMGENARMLIPKTLFFEKFGIRLAP